MEFTKIPANTFRELQLNAGILLSEFTPSTASFEEANLLGATSGGVNFTATPTYSDFGEDIDNCPKNMKELKKLDSWEVKMSGTFITANTTQAKSLVGAGDIDSIDPTKIIPRNDVKAADFSDIWWVGDYSDVNDTAAGGSGSTAGFIAIRMINALSTGGFQIQSGDKAKGQMAFEYTAHYSMDAQDTVPYEIYIKTGTASA